MKDPQMKAEACVIWMHGLGADASDMAGLANQLPIARLPLRHVFIDAPLRPVTINAGMKMRAWYDIFDLTFRTREDREGVLQSEKAIVEVIQRQIDDGFRANQIILAGFSQGGAMALYTALHCNLPLAGAIALSAYLPLALESKPVMAKDTPVFIGCGQFDPLVLAEWTLKTKEWLVVNGYAQVTLKQYPMEHSICAEEINDVVSWLSTHIRGVQTI
ncbi:MAG: carboxylesterase [Legionella sp.]|nr:carboxylesterase [Legionella sp.]